MKRSRGIVGLLTLGLVCGSVATAAAVVFITVPAGEMLSLQYRSRRGPGETDAIRATVKSRTVPRRPLPPGPCPILGSLQVIDASSGKTEVMMMPAGQRVVHEVIPAP